MSYDLHLFRLPEGADPAEVCSQLQAEEEQEFLDLEGGLERPLEQGKLEKMQALADSLKAICPTFVQFQPEHVQSSIELTEEKLQLQVWIQEDMATITMPYFREQSSEMMAVAGKCIDRLEKESGFVAYDPQLEKIVRATDLSDALAQYHAMDRHLPEILAESARGATTVNKPWWKIW